MQEKDPSMPYYGIWPYYPEDPLKGKKSPVDYNWADFIAVPLIDVIGNYSNYIDKKMSAQIKDALILAARAIVKRNVQPDYTNICIMGTYVCYIVGDIYNLPDITNYAQNRLTHFYNYTIKNKGFTEYNSPTYTLVAMNELLRMKQSIVNPSDKKMIDALYAMNWDMIARHFHSLSGQWCGPNLRSYNSLATPEFYRLLYNASDGIINLPGDYLRIPNMISPHKIPEKILPLFTHQILPRLEIDTFLIANPEKKEDFESKTGIKTIESKAIVGKLYAQPKYALASVNHGYMWNQTRPLIAHWGTPSKPSYLQVRFLHNLYDFSAVNITCAQDSNTVLAIFNVATDGGDTHPSIDPIKQATIQATDLRLRIEFGGDLSGTELTLPDEKNEIAYIKTNGLNFLVKIPYANWTGLKGYWTSGSDKNKKWIDYVIYSGENRTFNLSEMREAVLGLYLSILTSGSPFSESVVKTESNNDYLLLSYDNLEVNALKKPTKDFRLKNDYVIKY